MPAKKATHCRAMLIASRTEIYTLSPAFQADEGSSVDTYSSLTLLRQNRR